MKNRKLNIAAALLFAVGIFFTAHPSVFAQDLEPYMWQYFEPQQKPDTAVTTNEFSNYGSTLQVPPMIETAAAAANTTSKTLEMAMAPNTTSKTAAESQEVIPAECNIC